MVRVESSTLEADMKRDLESIEFSDAVHQTVLESWHKIMKLSFDNVSLYEINPKTGEPLVSPAKSHAFRVVLADMLLEAYGMKIREFHGKVDLKQKYWLTDEHYNYIIRYKDVQMEIQRHNRQYNGDGVGIDDFRPQSVLDEQKMLVLDEKKVNDNYANMLRGQITRLEKEYESAVNEDLKAQIKESIEKQQRLLSSIK